MENIKKQLNLKCYTSAGFYLSAVAGLLALVAAIVYGAGFQKETLAEYYSAAPVALLVVGVIVYLALEAFKPSAKFAPKALWVFTLVGLFAFIGTAYMYLSGIFYNGVTGEAISMIDPAFMGSLVIMLLSCILGNVSAWMNQTGKIENTSEIESKPETENETVAENSDAEADNEKTV